MPAGERRLPMGPALRVWSYWAVASLFVGIMWLVSEWWQIIAFLAFAFYTSLHHRKEVLHPWTWFPPFFAAYSLTYPASFLIFDLPYGSSAHMTMFLQGIALVSFPLGTGLLQAAEEPLYRARNFVKPVHFTERQRLVFRIILLALLFLTALYLLSVMSGGYTSKRDVKDAENGLIGALAVFYTVIPLAVMLLILRFHRLENRLGIALWLALIWLTLGYLIIGERDILFRMMFVFFLFWFDQRARFRLAYLYGLIFAAMVLMPFMQIMKGFFISGPSLLSYGIEEIFSGEFTAASRNLRVLIQLGASPGDGPPIGELLLRLIPLPGAGGMSFTQWFDDEFRPMHGIEGTAGWGFTMVGAGWLLGGFGGVVLLFASIGKITMSLYNQRFRSSYWYAIYLLYIPNSIYVLRADPVNYLNFTLKSVIAPAAIIYLVCWLLPQLLRGGSGSLVLSPAGDREPLRSDDPAARPPAFG